MSDKNIFRSEFAMVEVLRDESANGVRLSIRDMSTGALIYLDPLELEGLTRVDHTQLITLVVPPPQDMVPLDDLPR